MYRYKIRRTIYKVIKAVCPIHTDYKPTSHDWTGEQYPFECPTCAAIYELRQSINKLDSAIEDFETRATPWVSHRSDKRFKDHSDATEPAQLTTTI